MRKNALLLILFCSAFLMAQDRIESQIDDIMSKMTISEKIAIIHAQSKFSSAGVPRLGVPELWCSDGPHGVRSEVLWDEWNTANWTNDSCVAFPALTCLAATWNIDIAALYGKVIGEEALYRGKDVLLGPGVNIYRTPLNGRNFEYMGEDPYLSSRMVVPYVQGVQSNGVAACVKHYALNNQEMGRHIVDVRVSDRALYEIYLPAFKAAITQGKAWSIMGAYNRYQGQYACHNATLLQHILRDEWGFDGAVISDWGGCSNTWEAIHNGLDLEFGSWTDGMTEGLSNSYNLYYMAQPYLQLIEKGEVGTKELDTKVRNVLRLMFRTSMNHDKGYGTLCSDEHYAAARQIADEGIVLLKNDNKILPITQNTQSKIKKCLVVGENAIKPMTIGGGSSSLKAQREVLPLDAICRRAAQDSIVVSYARGYVGETHTVQDGFSTIDLGDQRSTSELIAEAVEKAKENDIVLFIGGLNKAMYQDCEGNDRTQYNLPYEQDKLIAALVKANPNTVVINISGNAVAMPWLSSVPAVLQAWYLGSEAGNAIADVLFGDVNPSGKMPFSIFPKLEDYPAHQYGEIGYPGIPDTDNEGKTYVEYKEDIFVGYRYADKAQLNPLFPFGHGLSYTTFAYSNPVFDDSLSTINLTVTNTGKVAGAEVVQLYIGEKRPTVPRPVKELKGFEKIYLHPGESQQISFTITSEMLAYFDVTKHDWVTNKGKYIIYIGSSSRDIRSKTTIDW